jgi:hypothetical protein
MATKAWTKLAPPDGTEMPSGVEVYEWVDLDSGDDGAPIIAPHRSDKTVQIVIGTAGDSSVMIEGTLDIDSSPGDYVVLNSSAGGVDAIDETVSGIFGVLQNVYRIRPRVDGTTGANHIVRLMVTTTARR